MPLSFEKFDRSFPQLFRDSGKNSTKISMTGQNIFLQNVA